MKTIRYVLMASLIGALALSVIPLASAAADSSPYVAPKDKAYIVFVKAGRGSRKMKFLIFDKDLKCVSLFEDNVSEIIPVKPGTHTLYTMANNAHRMEFNVEAGRTYFIRISLPKYGYGTVKLVPAKRDSDAFGQVKDWVKGGKASDPNEDACRGEQLGAGKRGKDPYPGKRDSADEKWKANAEYRDRLTMKKNDGFTAVEAGKL
jgi:hypothetical protein